MANLRKLVNQLIRLRPDVQDPEDAISSGQVFVDNRVITNPRALVGADASIVVRIPPPLRGEVKLKHALEEFAVWPNDKVALDVGAAAGGFTTALLRAGVRRVYAVEVGHGQLLGSLRQDERVVNLEGMNIAELGHDIIPEVIEVITLDLSYLSLSQAVPQLEAVGIAETADLIALVKPQFELALATPPSESSTLETALLEARRGIESGPWVVVGSIPSPVEGRRGAVEFLIHARRHSNQS